LTGRGSPQVAHIFPYTMLNEPRNPSPSKPTPDFWRLLGVFWNADRIARWKSEIFPDPQNPKTDVEGCFNLICLNSDAYIKWSMGLFALKPLELSDDRKKLTVQFFWQPQYSHQLGDQIDLLKEPTSSKGLSEVEKLELLPIKREREGKTYHLASFPVGEPPRRIHSGDTFSLTTDDPENKPLPSWQILEMQWVLQRLAAMSGAAGTPNIDLDDDDDMSSGPMLIRDDNDGDIKSYFNVYKWIQPPSTATG
jgi:hypothetical protein